MLFLSFKLSEDFVSEYKKKTATFGFRDAAGNSVGEITFLRTYSRKKEDGTKETWAEVCERVTNGTYSLRRIMQNSSAYNSSVLSFSVSFYLTSPSSSSGTLKTFVLMVFELIEKSSSLPRGQKFA